MSEHNILTDPELHEPKDISTANINEVYQSDGAGSGSWGISTGLNTVIIKTMSDFPAPATGVITLVAKTLYLITAELSTSDRFVLGSGTTIQMQSTSGVTLTYTGTGSMWTGVDVSCTFNFCRFIAATGKVFDISDTVGGLVNFTFTASVVISAAEFGSFSNLATASFFNSGTGPCTQGASFTGTSFNIISFINFGFFSTSATFIGVDLDAAVSARLNFTNLIVTAPSGAIGIEGLPNSGNIPVGNIGNIANCLFNGGMTTPLVGIDENSIRWFLVGNSANVTNTMPDALISLTANAVPTVIAGSSTPTLVLGTWVESRASHYTTTAAGRITYVGEKPITTPIDVILNMEPVSGTNKKLAVQIFKNGTLIAGTLMPALTDAGDPLIFTTMWQEQLVQNDFLEVYVSNESDGVNILVNDAVFRVR